MRTAIASDRSNALAQRFALLALALALVVAPVLANLWPAFGKGPMLYVGELAANGKDAGQAAHDSHEGHAPPAASSHHGLHCALCVLASQGWAPFAGFDPGIASARAATRVVPASHEVRRAWLVWPGSRARAPPFLS